MELGTLIGLLVALGAICAGNAVEGGHLSSVLQPTAAYVVLGGTLGAVLIQFPFRTLREALIAGLGLTPKTQAITTEELQKLLLTLSSKARREGIISIEREVSQISDPFVKKSLELVVDGFQAKNLRSVLSQELNRREDEKEDVISVFEAAGGYSPTVGILGAVLGLIHVMENLTDPSKLGPGIAVAFVATLYGVGMANLFFLPLAGRLRHNAKEQSIFFEITMEGACSLADGEGPLILEQRLNAYIQTRSEKAPEAAPLPIKKPRLR